MEGHQEVTNISLSLLEGGGVSEHPLVVRHGPLRSGHYSQIVVSLRVDASE